MFFTTPKYAATAVKYNLWELKKHELYSSAWWCNFTILKNHGVKVNGVGMIHSYEMEVIIQPWFQTTNQIYTVNINLLNGIYGMYIYIYMDTLYTSQIYCYFNY